MTLRALEVLAWQVGVGAGDPLASKALSSWLQAPLSSIVRKTVRTQRSSRPVLTEAQGWRSRFESCLLDPPPNSRIRDKGLSMSLLQRSTYSSKNGVVPAVRTAFGELSPCNSNTQHRQSAQSKAVTRLIHFVWFVCFCFVLRLVLF